MKRYSTALLFCTLSLAGPLAHADMIDDAIGNIQQAINDAYHPGDSRSDDDEYDNGRYQDSRQRQYDDQRQQLEDRRRELDERQRQLDRDRHQLESDQRRLDDAY